MQNDKSDLRMCKTDPLLEKYGIDDAEDGGPGEIWLIFSVCGKLLS